MLLILSVYNVDSNTFLFICFQITNNNMRFIIKYFNFHGDFCKPELFVKFNRMYYGNINIKNDHY